MAPSIQTIILREEKKAEHYHVEKRSHFLEKTTNKQTNKHVSVYMIVSKQFKGKYKFEKL